MSLKGYFQAVRAFSFTATMVSIVLGAALGAREAGGFSWALLAVTAICALLLHAGTNVLSDYFDFKKGVDTDYSFGSSKVISEKLLTPKEVLIEAIVIFSAAVLLSLILIAYRGWPIVALGVIGLLAGVFYGWGPSYKYIALGDLAVFVMFGPLMVLGSFYVQAQHFSVTAFILSLPAGFLVAAILVGNNIRDIKHDSEARVKTVANLLGPDKAKWEYYLLVAAAYCCVAALTLARMVPFWSLIVLVTLPIAFSNIRLISHSSTDNPAAIADVDVRTAKLHLIFGILLIVSVLIGMAI